MSHLDVREQGSREQQRELPLFVPPVSLEGQRWLASAIGNRAFSEAVVARKRPDVAFEDETVHGDSWFDGVESRMFDIENGVERQRRQLRRAGAPGVRALRRARPSGRVESIAGEVTGEQFAECTRRRGRWRWSSAS